MNIDPHSALARELRTANLIAVLSMGPVSLADGGSIGVTDDRLIAIQREVLERLEAR